MVVGGVVGVMLVVMRIVEGCVGVGVVVIIMTLSVGSGIMLCRFRHVSFSESFGFI